MDGALEASLDPTSPTVTYAMRLRHGLIAADYDLGAGRLGLLERLAALLDQHGLYWYAVASGGSDRYHLIAAAHPDSAPAKAFVELGRSLGIDMRVGGRKNAYLRFVGVPPKDNADHGPRLLGARSLSQVAASLRAHAPAEPPPRDASARSRQARSGPHGGRRRADVPIHPGNQWSQPSPPLRTLPTALQELIAHGTGPWATGDGSRDNFRIARHLRRAGWTEEQYVSLAMNPSVRGLRHVHKGRRGDAAIRWAQGTWQRAGAEDRAPATSQRSAALTSGELRHLAYWARIHATPLELAVLAAFLLAASRTGRRDDLGFSARHLALEVGHHDHRTVWGAARSLERKGVLRGGGVYAADTAAARRGEASTRWELIAPVCPAAGCPCVAAAGEGGAVRGCGIFDNLDLLRRSLAADVFLPAKVGGLSKAAWRIWLSCQDASIDEVAMEAGFVNAHGEVTPGTRRTVRKYLGEMTREGLVEETTGRWAAIDALDVVAVRRNVTGVREEVRAQHELERAAHLQRLNWGRRTPPAERAHHGLEYDEAPSASDVRENILHRLASESEGVHRLPTPWVRRTGLRQGRHAGVG